MSESSPVSFSMPPLPADHVLVAVILRQDQSRPLGQLLEQMRANGFFDNFPPPGVEPASWVNIMGFGQVATFRVPPARLREFNVSVERHVWGAYRTEVHPAYDFMEAARELHAAALARQPG